MIRSSWQMLLKRAAALRTAGRFEEGIAAYRRLLAVRPDLAESWYNLAWLQRSARHYTQALTSYAEALARGVSAPEEVHLNRAVIFSDHLHRHADAMKELDAALAIAPDYVPAMLNLGNLHEDEGDRTAARSAYRRALNCDPGNVIALARLAGLTVADSPRDPLIVELRGRLSDPSLTSLDRADLAFALGRLLDQAGEYDAAFAAYEYGNSASRDSRRGEFPDYDPVAHERLVDQLMTTFSLPESSPLPYDGRVPLFICGMFRSGSTLVERILSRHPTIAAGGELDLLPTIVADKLQPYPEVLEHAPPALLDECRRDYLKGFALIAPEAAIVSDKRPDNFLHIGLIKRLFPSARIIHTRRNALDNILSLYFLHLNPAMSYALDLEHAAHWYCQQERVVAHWKSLYPDDILDVDYDELVRSPEPVIRSMVEFCGVGWEPSMLKAGTSRGAVKTASVWQVREPLYQHSSGRWRHYERHLIKIRRVLEEGRF